MGVNEDISAMLNPGSSQEQRDAASARWQKRNDDRNAQKKDVDLFKVAASGMIGAAIAKTLFGNRGS